MQTYWQGAKWRPLAQVPPSRLGSVSQMDAGDWLMIAGGAIVAGTGLNGIYAGVTARKTNFIGIALGATLATVGVMVVGQKVTKLGA